MYIPHVTRQFKLLIDANNGLLITAQNALARGCHDEPKHHTRAPPTCHQRRRLLAAMRQDLTLVLALLILSLSTTSPEMAQLTLSTPMALKAMEGLVAILRTFLSLVLGLTIRSQVSAIFCTPCIIWYCLLYTGIPLNFNCPFFLMHFHVNK